MHLVPLSYVTSERFIHDDLRRYCATSIETLYTIWKKDKRVDPLLLTWPSIPIEDDEGRPIKDVCACELPKDALARRDMIRKMVDRTKAYALFLVEERVEMVKAILESAHGTRSWTLPVRRSADVRVLGKPAVKDNVDFVGLLWSPIQGKT